MTTRPQPGTLFVYHPPQFTVEGVVVDWEAPVHMVRVRFEDDPTLHTMRWQPSDSLTMNARVAHSE